MTQQEREALQLVTDSLVEIRLLTSGKVRDLPVLLIHELADAVHNIPALVANKDPSERDALRFFLHSELRDVREVYRRAVAARQTRKRLADRIYSLNGTPNASRAVLGGRCSAPITFGCLPIAFQIRSATAFIYSSRTCSRTLPR